jgi:hypothetical protein
MGEELEQRHEVQQVATPATSDAPVASSGPVYGASSATTSRSSVTRRVSGNETARRVVMLLFGIVQVVILLRFALLLLGANDTGIVNAVYSFSHIFVGPFIGIFGTVKSGASVLEAASVAALVGWTILEFLVLAILQIVTRRPEGRID